MEYTTQQEYLKHKEKLRELGIEMGKSFYKYFNNEKFDNLDYTDMYRIFTVASDVVNEKLFDEFMREKGLIPKFKSLDWGINEDV